jgi:DNA polymerase-1
MIPLNSSAKAAEIILPNIRKLFVPDEDQMMFDMDLAGADAQVVAWEADDDDLKNAFRSRLDIHSFNAKTLFGLSEPVAEIKKLHNPKRQMAKRWVHGTNYGGSARTMAITCGISVAESERFQKRWFGMHPGIAAWHQRTKRELSTSRTVRNRFGYRRYYFDRPDEVLGEALAWGPQSTVACVTNEIWLRLRRQTKVPFQIHFPVHDSLVGQYPAELHETALRIIDTESRVVIPYEDPLVIPIGIKTSRVSWGDCA